MSHSQSCHLEEGGENGEAQEEVEVSFEVGGITWTWSKGMGDPDFINPPIHSVCVLLALGWVSGSRLASGKAFLRIMYLNA